MTETLLLLIAAGLVAVLCWANVERKGKTKRAAWKTETLRPAGDKPVDLTGKAKGHL